LGCTLKTAYTSQSQRNSSIVFENAEECGFEGKYTHRPTPGETSPDPITTLCLAGVCFARYISQHSAISYQTNLENDENMEVALQGVQDYWQRYCKRHELKSEITAQGQRFISLDNNYWADYTMQELKDKVVQHLKRKRQERRIAERPA